MTFRERLIAGQKRAFERGDYKLAAIRGILANEVVYVVEEVRRA